MLSALARRWAAFRAEPSDAGLTLTELIISSSLAALVGGLALVFFVGSNTSTAKTGDESFTTGQARAAMSTSVRLLELADTPTSNPGAATSRFLTVSPNEVVFFSNSNGNRPASAARTAPVKVDLVITSANALVLNQYAPISATPSDWTTNYPSAPTSVQTLLTGLSSTSGFTYCAAATAAGTCTTTTSPIAVTSVVVALNVAVAGNTAAQSFVSTATITGATQ